MSQGICKEKSLEMAWVVLKLWWSGVSGNHQGGANSIGQAYGDSDIAPVCQL